MGWIYKADVYCEECGERICKSLRGTHPALCPEDWMDTGSYDSDDFPKPADVEEEESDSPNHCGQCRKFLRNPLTSYGYTYVKEKLDESRQTQLGKLSGVLSDWAHWYNFTYWDAVDCAEDGRHTVPGWYSSEAF